MWWRLRVTRENNVVRGGATGTLAVRVEWRSTSYCSKNRHWNSNMLGVQTQR